MENMLEGNVSGRDRIYANIFNGWLDSDNFINLLFGYGFAGSRLLSGSGHFAHNDWLELLSNFGLLGVTIYIVLFYSASKFIRNNKWGSDKKIIFIRKSILIKYIFNYLIHIYLPMHFGYW